MKANKITIAVTQSFIAQQKVQQELLLEDRTLLIS